MRIAKDPDTFDHPRRARKARRLLWSGIALGVTLVVIGHLYIFFGPIHTVPGFVNWIVGINIVGTMLVLMSAVGYFTYMENLEPKEYRHEENAPTWGTESGYSSSEQADRRARREPRYA